MQDKCSSRQVNFIFDRLQVTGTPHMLEIVKEDGSLQHIESLDKWTASMLIDAINARDDHAFDDAYFGYDVAGDHK